MNANLLASDRTAVVGAIDPDAQTASTHNSGWVAAKDFHSFLIIIMAGVLGTSATLDAKIEQATDGAGTGAKDIAGKAITQLTKAGGDDAKQALINLRPDELDTNNAFTHFRVAMTVATATSDAGALVLGLSPRYGEASANDAAAVAEIVA